MKDRNSPLLGKDVVNKISSSIALSPEQIYKKIVELKDRGLNSAQIYEELMNGNGVPSTHDSGKPEGGLKEGHKSHHTRKSRKSAKRIYPSW